MPTYPVPPALAGTRLDQLLPQLHVGLTRSYGQQLISAGHVLVNGRAAKAGQKLRAGDVVTVVVPAPAPVEIAPAAIPLNIVYEDADLLVVDKPAGLVVHPAPGHRDDTLVNALLAHTQELALHGDIRPGIVHRLDRDTSGLLVVARTDAAHAALTAQQTARQMQKEYLALVLGTPQPPDGLIDAPIGRHPRERKQMAVVGTGRPARTRYWTARAYGHLTLLRARLITGRTHQIRVHCAYIGHPIIGDPLYGRRAAREAQALGLTRPFLHAARLGFTLPSSGAWREFTAPLPPELAAVLARLEGEQEPGVAGSEKSGRLLMTTDGVGENTPE